MKNLEELKPLIVSWATEKNIHLKECVPKQKLKLIEECGELAHAILKEKVSEQKDAIGDIFVVLVIMAEQLDQEIYLELGSYDINHLDEALSSIIYDSHSYNHDASDINDSFRDLLAVCELTKHDLTECANLAWNEIKDRKGKTVNGTFIKESDQ